MDAKCKIMRGIKCIQIKNKYCSSDQSLGNAFLHQNQGFLVLINTTLTANVPMYLSLLFNLLAGCRLKIMLYKVVWKIYRKNVVEKQVVVKHKKKQNELIDIMKVQRKQQTKN